ncbi:hypothetical protein ACFO1B_09765 [Dactylosporangium siamense]|uniref:Transposase n=1 Tax=Dactylosporangium siamense TaxID=685454 RepID=A0A919PRW2_9ACTN|nr:hypothetical protein Dsi01nite_070200 [Dactylosporangium siamense]
MITADALHCQRDHVTYLAQRGAHWIFTAKGNQPTVHQQLAGLPWRLVPVDRTTDRGHGRREIRTTITSPTDGGTSLTAAIPIRHADPSASPARVNAAVKADSPGGR